jgi:hypothetical protein
MTEQVSDSNLGQGTEYSDKFHFKRNSGEFHIQ